MTAMLDFAGVALHHANHSMSASSILATSNSSLLNSTTLSPMIAELSMNWSNRSYQTSFLLAPLELDSTTTTISPIFTTIIPTTTTTVSGFSFHRHQRRHSTNLIGSILPWIRTLNYLIVICSAIGICALCFCLLSIILFAFHRLWYGAGGLYNDSQLRHVDTLTVDDKNQPSLQYFASLTNAPESVTTTTSSISSNSSSERQVYQYGFPKTALRNYCSVPLAQTTKSLLYRSNTTANTRNGLFPFNSSQFFPKMDLGNSAYRNMNRKPGSNNQRHSLFKSSNCVISLEDDLTHSSQTAPESSSRQFNLHFRSNLTARQPPLQPPPPPPTHSASVPISSMSWLVHHQQAQQSSAAAAAAQPSNFATLRRATAPLSTYYAPSQHMYQSIPDIRSGTVPRPVQRAFSNSGFYPIPAERKSIKASSNASKSLLILPVKLLKQQHRNLKPVTKYKMSHNYMNTNIGAGSANTLPYTHQHPVDPYGHHYRNHSQIQLQLQEEAHARAHANGIQLQSLEENEYLSTYSEVISELKNRFVIKKVQY